MGPSQAFAAPYDGTQMTIQVANTTNPTPTPKEVCEKYVGELIGLLRHQISDTQKKIDYIKGKIAHTDNDKIKQYLMNELHRQETKLAQLKGYLDQVLRVNCDNRK